MRPDEIPHLALTDREGTFLRVLTRDSGEDADPRPSPDGKMVAYVHWPDDDRNRRDIRIVDLESGATRLLVGAPKMKDWFPRWSPDGKWIAFLSQRTDYNQVWLIRPDGTDMRQVTDLGTNVEEFSWSPDGTRLAIIVNRRGRLDLAATSLTSGKTEEIKVGRGVYSRPQWSPDGAYHLRRV